MVSAVVTPTFDAHRATTPFGWFYEYRICGIASLVVFAIALVGLRELSPALRDQLMVSAKDRALIEARAQGMTESDVAAGLRNPFRQMLHLDVIGSAFAIAVFLIIYYIAVGFFPIFFQTVYGYTASQANGIGNYFWAFDAGGLIVIGWLSDRLRVRKPFMIVGGVGAVVCTLVFGLYGTAGGTIKGWAAHSGGTNLYAASSGFFIVILILLSLSLAFAFAPWMASFTETVERHNPALTATGLAVWGMVLRIVIAIAIVIAPHIVSSVTPVVEKGPVLTAYLSDPTPVRTPLGSTTLGGVASAVAAVDPKTLATLQADPTGPALGTATGEISRSLGVSKAQAVTDLLAASTVGKPGASPQLTKAITYLQANGAEVQKAKAQEPGQWMNYFWVGVGGEVVFIPLIFLMAGFWDPRRAKRAAEEHEAMVAEELARLESART